MEETDVENACCPVVGSPTNEDHFRSESSLQRYGLRLLPQTKYQKDNIQPTSPVVQRHKRYKKKRPVGSFCLGPYTFAPYNYSPYPEQFEDVACILLCMFCVEPWKTVDALKEHELKCPYQKPFGSKIYEDNGLSVVQVPGYRYTEFCQHLVLLGQSFIACKIAEVAIENFNFYLVWDQIEGQNHLIGYFSREYMLRKYNLNCFLVLPPHLRKGYGYLMIDISYAVVRSEEGLGSPERPFTKAGKATFERYWKSAIAKFILNVWKQPKSSDIIAIDAICKATGMCKRDVRKVLLSMKLICHTPCIKGDVHKHAVKANIESLKQLCKNKDGKVLFRPHCLRLET